MSTSVEADLVLWTVFTVSDANQKLILTEAAHVKAFGEDDAIISAAEKLGKPGQYFAVPESESYGRKVDLFHHARFYDPEGTT